METVTDYLNNDTLYISFGPGERPVVPPGYQEIEREEPSWFRGHLNHGVVVCRKVGGITRVKDLQSSDYTLVTNDREIGLILRYIGKLDELDDTGSLLVKIEESGADYEEVWQCAKTTPWLEARVWKLL